MAGAGQRGYARCCCAGGGVDVVGQRPAGRVVSRTNMLHIDGKTDSIGRLSTCGRPRSGSGPYSNLDTLVYLPLLYRLRLEFPS